MTVEKINETLERLEYAGSSEVFDFVFPLMESIKDLVERLNDELISPKSWIGLSDLIKYLLELFDEIFD